MNLKSFEKTDQKILGVSLLLLLLSSYLLWQDGWIYNLVQKKNSDLQEIGRISFSKNDVRRRYEVALSWLPIKEKNNIYQGDSIFTGEDSSATIETQKGEKIFISPNSLVVINQKTDSISLDIGFGSVQGQIENGKKLLITSNNNITELIGDNATIKVDAGEGNKLVLNVLSGQVKISTPTGTKILSQDDATEIAIDGQTQDLIQPGVQLLAPLANQYLLPEEDKPVLFKWKTAKPSARMKIKISVNSDLSNPLVDSRLNDNFYMGYNLPRDTELFWQVLTESGASEIRKMAVVGDRPPIPIYPKTGSQLYYDPSLPSQQLGINVDLNWERGSLASHFEVQVATDDQFNSVIRSAKAKEKAISLGVLSAGEYFWRVRSIDYANQKWSDTSVFRVGPEPTLILAPPVTLSSSKIYLIPTKTHSQPAATMSTLSPAATQTYIETFPRIEWSAVSEADHYIFEISNNKQFTDIIKKQKTTKTFYTWKNIAPGSYFWRVKAMGEKFKDGKFTLAQELVLATTPPETLSQSLIVDQVPDPILLKVQPPPLELKWLPTVFAKSYELQFSNNTQFKGATTILTENNSRRVQIPSPGVYYWRIRAIDKNKKPLSPFSTAYVLEFQRVYKDPTLIKDLMGIYPKQQDSIILVGGKNSELEFTWTKPYKKANYRIEIASDPSFQVVLFSDITTENFYKYKEKFTTRVVYWRVRAETDEFVTDWTGANRFLVSYENQPFDFDTSDLMFAARIKAKERQDLILSAREKKLARMRTPAGLLDLQLDTPELIDPPSQFLIDSNINPELNPLELVKQPYEKFFTQIRSAPIFKWNKVPAAERYVLQIARDPEFNNIIVKAPAWNPFYAWDTVRPGLFYYRVQAFNERYTRSQYSRVQKLEVAVNSPATISPDVFVEYFDEPKELWPPPKSLDLSWQSVAFARGYEVEIANNKDLKDSKRFRSLSAKAEVRVPTTGLYYWRVRAINENGVGVSSFSSVRSIEVLQAQRGPATVNGLTALFPKDRTMLFVGDGLINMAFHWASPNPKVSTDIEISNSPDFANVLAKIKGRNGVALLKEDLPEGRLYWRVRDLNSRSAVNEFILKRERAPYVSETVQKAAH